jgi:hypothetical protein
MSSDLQAALIELSVADDWRNAVREWHPVGCERKECNCICGQKLKTVYHIRNHRTSWLSGVGSSCIKQFHGTHLSAPLTEMLKEERKKSKLPVAERQLPEQYRITELGLMKYKDIMSSRHVAFRHLILKQCRLSTAVKVYLRSAQS